MMPTPQILTSNFHRYDPTSLAGYLSLGGFGALKQVLAADPLETIALIRQSELRGRGGAAYPTGLKLEQALAIPGTHKIIICNADEGEPGTFKDRAFITHDPFRIVEGLITAAYLTGCHEGYIYIREEYAHLHHLVRNAVARCREAGYLGRKILGSELDFDLHVFSGAGAYVCGEGGALVESMEGHQGRPRRKPPHIKECGLFKLPTLVINVETLCAIVAILTVGVDRYIASGVAGEVGSKVISVSGKINRPGVYEVPFGITLRSIITEVCGGTPQGRPIHFIQVGGASGPIIPGSMLDLKLSYDAFKAIGFDIGTGAIVVADDTISLAAYLMTVYGFFSEESCGKCTPCREGNRQIYEQLKAIHCGEPGAAVHLDRAESFAGLMQDTAFCGLGTTACVPLLSAIKFLHDDLLAPQAPVRQAALCPAKSGSQTATAANEMNPITPIH